MTVVKSKFDYKFVFFFGKNRVWFWLQFKLFSVSLTSEEQSNIWMDNPRFLVKLYLQLVTFLKIICPAEVAEKLVRISPFNYHNSSTL